MEVVNVVGTITYQQELALDALGETFSHRNEITSITYEPAENHWLQARFAPDDTYVAFYRSGRCSITGCKSVEHFHEVVGRVNSVMRDLLQSEYKPKVEISNIVTSADIESTVPLEMISIELGMNRVEYEPEQFPALIYRGPDFVVLVFASGKLLCTGLTNVDDATEVIDGIKSRLRPIL